MKYETLSPRKNPSKTSVGLREMDLLCKSYSNTSDDDDGDGDGDGDDGGREDRKENLSIYELPSSKRLKSTYQASKPQIGAPHSQSRAPITGSGRYISKREKALMASFSTDQPDSPRNLTPSPGVAFFIKFVIAHG